MSSQKKNKAQAEIMGLVVIVIIISVALLFYVSMNVNSDKNTKKTIFRQYANNDLSASFTKALKDTSVCGTNIDGLIADCATRKQLNCEGLTSCEKLNETLVNITNQTLDVWGYVYDMVIYFPDDTFPDGILDIGSGECNRKTIGRSPPSPYAVSLFPWAGVVRIELGICN